MRYTEDNARKVMDGTKTMTRRLIKPGEYLHVFPDGHKEVLMRRGHSTSRTPGAGRTKWAEGHVYAVQPGRGKKAIGYARLLEVHEELLQDIDDMDICAEMGAEFPGPGHLAFMALWDSINTRSGTRWNDNPRVWTLTIEVVHDEPEEDYDRHNFDDHYAAFWNFGPAIDGDGGDE